MSSHDSRKQESYLLAAKAINRSYMLREINSGTPFKRFRRFRETSCWQKACELSMRQLNRCASKINPLCSNSIFGEIQSQPSCCLCLPLDYFQITPPAMSFAINVWDWSILYWLASFFRVNFVVEFLEQIFLFSQYFLLIVALLIVAWWYKPIAFLSK